MAQAIKSREVGLLLALGCLWGVAFMFISLGLESFSPVLLAALRFDIVALAMLPVVLYRRKGSLLPIGPKQWTAVLVAGAFNVAAYHAFLFWGQQFTTAAVAAVIVGLNPVITTVFSRWLLTDDRVGVGGLVGLGLGLTGIVLLASLKGGSVTDAQGIGELVVVGAIASWSLGSVIVKRTGHGMDVFAFIMWHSLAGALLLHLGAFAFEGGGTAVFDLSGTLSLLYLALASSGLGFVIYFTLIERIGPIRVNLVSYIAPVFAAVAGFLVLGSPFELRAVLAFLLIVGGFALVARPAPGPKPG